jgi:hypothetical protein
MTLETFEHRDAENNTERRCHNLSVEVVIAAISKSQSIGPACRDIAAFQDDAARLDPSDVALAERLFFLYWSSQGFLPPTGFFFDLS